MSERCYAYRIKQDGMVVARVEGDEWIRTLAEIQHYALMYAQDGPIEAEERNRETGRWRRIFFQTALTPAPASPDPKEMNDEA